jgi:hypothetical protein
MIVIRKFPVNWMQEKPLVKKLSFNAISSFSGRSYEEHDVVLLWFSFAT